MKTIIGITVLVLTGCSLAFFLSGCIPLIALGVANHDIQRQHDEQIRQANLREKEIEYTHQEHMLAIAADQASPAQALTAQALTAQAPPACTKTCYYDGGTCYTVCP